MLVGDAATYLIISQYYCGCLPHHQLALLWVLTSSSVSTIVGAYLIIS